MNQKVILASLGILIVFLLLNTVDGRVRFGKRSHSAIKKRSRSYSGKYFRSSYRGNAEKPQKKTTHRKSNLSDYAENRYRRPSYLEKYYERDSMKPQNKKRDPSGCSPGKKSGQLAGCVETQQAEYRTFDGKYNQQGGVSSAILGASFTPFVRLLPPDYDDGIGFPKGTDPSVLYNGYPLPLPRSVSLEFTVDGFTLTDTHTSWVTIWGQLVTHDIVDRATFACEDIDCSDCDVVDNFCFPIVNPVDDPFFTEECMGVRRDAPVCGTGTTTKNPRMQLNKEVSFHDGSVVYGESGEEVGKLRDLTNELGLLKKGLEKGPTGKPYLPQQTEDDELATLPVNFCDPGQRCFVSGDVRTLENWALLSTHTILFREHNRLATRLHELNPHWNGDKLFMEARKILGAQMQHITYTQFLSKLIGDETVQDRIGVYKGFDKTVNPGAISSFVTGAFRIHNFNKPVMDRLDKNFQEAGTVPFPVSVGNPNQLVEEEALDPVLRGLGISNKDTTDVTHTIFTNDTFLDLPTIDILRGRSYGLPTYPAWRKFCGIDTPKDYDRYLTFKDLRREITSRKVRQQLKKLYGTPENIDMWIAGVLEDPANGGITGPMFGCIIAEQFRRLRDGDSFYYENPGMFTEEQLNEIRKYSLSRLICDNGDAIKRVQRNVFIPVKDKSEYLDCSDIPYVDLTKWEEKDTCDH